VDKEKKSVYAARISALYYNRAQINGIPKTLAADNTNIAHNIHWVWSLII
jgi:hypothetical protein